MMKAPSFALLLIWLALCNGSVVRLVPAFLGLTVSKASNSNQCSTAGECNGDQPMATSNAVPGDAPTELLDELQKMGWSAADAQRALQAAGHDALAAASWLEQEDEEAELKAGHVETVVQAGWSDDAATIAVNITAGNVTAALELLEREEKEIMQTFNARVKELMEHDLDELPARQALMVQWQLNRNVAKGQNVTVSRDVLDRISPTLRRTNSTEGTPKPVKTASKKAAKPRAPEMKAAAAVKKEEVVFAVTADTYQALVMESKVPVLVDVYADWCGPCKQLTPMLEEAAVRAGGLFRLAKVNADQDRALVEALGVSAFPTVFASNKGKINDRFRGLLPANQIQAFLMRAVTGEGQRVQAAEFSDAEAAAISANVASLAGLASLNGDMKRKILNQVDAALNREAFATSDRGRPSLAPGPATALQYITNCKSDIMNEKYRTIAKGNKAFVRNVLPSASAMQLLAAAGFEGDGVRWDLRLTHSNVAILDLVLVRADKIVSDQRFSKMKAHAAGEFSIPPRASSAAAKPPTAPASAAVAKKVKVLPKATKTSIGEKKKIVLSYRGDVDGEQRALQGEFSGQLTLQEAWQKLHGDEEHDDDLEIRFPLPRRVLDKRSKLWNGSLKEIAGDGLSIALATAVSDRSKTGRMRGFFGKKKASRKAQVTNEDKPKHDKRNEYFGGDSTVFLSADDDE